VADEGLLEELTIEQLAARTGLSVRNIRAHATRGLLQPPRLRGRLGLYGEDHLHRLQLITRLQDQGFNLASIARLIDGLPEPDLTVELYQRAMGPWLVETPVEMTVVELAGMFGEQPDRSRLTRLRRAGVIELLGDDRVRVLNPTLLRVGARCLELGFDTDALLRVLAMLVSHTRAIADELVTWFLGAHWEPYVAAGRPAEQLPELERVLEAVQPVAADGVVAAFRQAMSEAVAAAFEQIAEVAIATPAARPVAG
jgi:DNA-binding transcriptional MerR regulator